MITGSKFNSRSFFSDFEICFKLGGSPTVQIVTTSKQFPAFAINRKLIGFLSQCDKRVKVICLYDEILAIIHKVSLCFGQRYTPCLSAKTSIILLLFHAEDIIVFQRSTIKDLNVLELVSYSVLRCE